MNKELKEQVKQYFEANLLDGDKMEDCGKAVITIDQDFIEIFDSLIDKTVQMTEERIVGVIKQMLLDINFLEGITGEENRDIVYKNHKKMKEYLSLITNKSDINNNKE